METLADYPDLCAQFHPTKNGDLLPKTVTAGTGKKVWWKYPEGDGHIWDAPLKSRTGKVSDK